MDRNAQALADQLLALPSHDRSRLAELRLASLEDRDPDAGEVVGIAAADVFAEVERRLRR